VRRALAGAEAVVAFSCFRSEYLEAAASVVLPIAAFAETAGTFVSGEGRVQTFNGAVPAPGEARPGWKVLRVLGNELSLPGFDYESPEQVLADALPATPRMALSNAVPVALEAGVHASAGERIADVPAYFTDSLVRHAESLQQTVTARAPVVRANAATLAHFGVTAGSTVRVRQGDAAVLMPCAIDERLPDRVVRVPAGHASTAGLGPMFGTILLERA
jgi:NADH-quinone oxidoreductase subunit G